MKAYIVTLFNLPESIKFAERCKRSAAVFDIDAELYPAVWRDIAQAEAIKENLTVSNFDTSFSNIDSVIGNFITQYRIWRTIAVSSNPGIVLEHDALFFAKLPDLENKGDIINLGRPSYGAYNAKQSPGVYPMFSKTGGYIPGAHCYYLTPNGANQLISFAKIHGIAPCDLFLNRRNFPNIKEIYPWIAEADDEFTTIQHEKGCTAKHNYNSNYIILK